MSTQDAVALTKDLLRFDTVNPPEQFEAFIRNEMAKWSKIIREAGIKAE